MKLEDWPENLQGYLSDCLGWFDLEKYKKTESWTTEQWLIAIIHRQYLFFNLFHKFPNFNFNLLSVVFDNLLNNDISIVDLDTYFPPALSQDMDIETYLIKFINNSVTLKASIEAKPFIEMAKNRDIACVIKRSLENTDFNEFFNLYDTDRRFFITDCLENKAINYANDSYRFKIDHIQFAIAHLHGPDEEIIMDFIEWLRTAKKHFNVPRLSPRTANSGSRYPRMRIEKTDLLRWSRWRILAYIDLRAWRRYFDKKPIQTSKYVSIMFCGSVINEKETPFDPIPEDLRLDSLKEESDWLMSPNSIRFIRALVRNSPLLNDPEIQNLSRKLARKVASFDA